MLGGLFGKLPGKTMQRCGLIGQEEPQRRVRLMAPWFKHETQRMDAKGTPIKDLDEFLPVADVFSS